MASHNILKLTAILSLTISILLSFHPQATSSFEIENSDEEEEEEEEEYVPDHPLIIPNLRSRSRFLRTSGRKDKISKGAHCESNSYHNICNGISVNNGNGVLHCCKNHCRNVHGDSNNCGGCGKRCRLGQRCCGGVCTDVGRNVNNCGKCGNRCSSGVKCEFGYCGYA